MFGTLQFQGIANPVCLSAAATPELITRHCGRTPIRWLVYMSDILLRLLDLFRTELAQHGDL